ncbi:MAG: alpha/beta hydrolase [Acidobacteriaceae bacterium]|nr:alpha/beta hydrolase [Acidobacteriaceae bacterium]
MGWNLDTRPATRAARAWAIISKTALVIAIFLMLLASAGALYQRLGTWRDARRFHQQGKYVQAGHLKLNLDCTGKRDSPRSPVVVLDSGLGVPALGWILVQPEVAKFARVCSYDRAGYGWSDPGLEPRTSVRIAKELKSLLDKAGEHAPYVMVGHSFGGFNVRIFTSLFPADVAGLVLVEGSHEDEDRRMAELLPASVIKREEKVDQWNERKDRFLKPLRFWLGIRRLEVQTGWGTPDYGVLQSRRLPQELREELLFLRQQAKFQNAVAGEAKAFVETVAEIRKAGALGDRPLIVLTAGNPLDPDPILTRDQQEKLTNLWIHVLQAEEAHLSGRGKQIVVADSGHMVPFDRPDAVVSAIHEVWSAAKH